MPRPNPAFLVHWSSAFLAIAVPQVVSPLRLIRKWCCPTACSKTTWCSSGDIRVPVWGTADDGSRITVSIAGEKAETTASQGRWRVGSAAAEGVGGPYTLVIQGMLRNTTSRFERKNVLVGDVWIAGGQSNMEWALSYSADGPTAVAASPIRKSASSLSPIAPAASRNRTCGASGASAGRNRPPVFPPSPITSAGRSSAISTFQSG